LSEPVICLNFLKEETKTPFGLNAGLCKDEAMDAALPDMISATLHNVNDTGIRRVFIGGARGPAPSFPLVSLSRSTSHGSRRRLRRLLLATSSRSCTLTKTGH